MSEHSLPLLPLVLAGTSDALSRVLTQEGIAHQAHELAPLAGRFVLFDSSRAPCPPLAPDQLGIDLHPIAAEFDEDPLETLDDEQSRRARWRVGHLLASEQVARVDKREVRRQLLARLRSVIEAAGGVWLRAAAFPYPYRSAFNFRLDHDEYQSGDFNTVLQVAGGFENCFSHFVCGSTHAEYPEALARLRGLDVGSHGYWHHTYADADENYQNLARGIEVLESHGIEPSGFVAPGGRYNRGLAAAMNKLGISHSSEFSLAYDELPFFPTDSRVLQIPIHPVCLGICLEAAAENRTASEAALWSAADAAVEHFRWIATAKYQAGEPVFLYGHPDRRLGAYPNVLRGVLQTVGGFAAIWRTTLTGFGAWWRARALLKLRVLREADHYVVMVDHKPEGYRFGVEYWRGEHVAPMPLDLTEVRFSPEALAFQGRKPREMPKILRLDQPEDLRLEMLRYLDWEKVTPVGEISTRTWRGWVKRALRRIRT